MKIFDPETCKKPPRADMFLPNWLNALGFLLDATAVFFLVVTFVTRTWGLIAVFGITIILGVGAHLCWKNQMIRIVGENYFEYSTFLGKKIQYRFSDIKSLRVNQDSLTLFVGEGKVHIEACAVMSKKLMNKIDNALARQEASDING